MSKFISWMLGLVGLVVVNKEELYALVESLDAEARIGREWRRDYYGLLELIDKKNEEIRILRVNLESERLRLELEGLIMDDNCNWGCIDGKFEDGTLCWWCNVGLLRIIDQLQTEVKDLKRELKWRGIEIE